MNIGDFEMASLELVDERKSRSKSAVENDEGKNVHESRSFQTRAVIIGMLKGPDSSSTRIYSN